MSFLTSLVDGIRTAASSVGDAIDNASASAVQSLLGTKETSILDWYLNTYADAKAEVLSNPRVPSSYRTMIERTEALPIVGQVVAQMVFLAGALPATLAALHGATLEIIRQDVNREQRPSIPTGAEALDMWRRQVIDSAQLATILTGWGIKDEDVEHFKLATRTLLDATSLRDLFLRHSINDVALDNGLQRLGYSPADVPLVKSLFAVLPPIADLITMSVREVFSPADRVALDLDADFPAHFAELAAQQGLSEEWARNYWAMHWQLPSPTEAFDMLHRRQITEAQLNQLLKAQDFAPTWRAKLAAISYHVPTRVDTRRMYEFGAINRDEMKSLLQDGGYNEVNAERLTKFYEKLTVEGDVGKKKRARDLTLGMVAEAFRDGVIDQAQYTAYLQGLNYDADEIATIVGVDEYKRNREWFREFENSVKALYVKGYWSGDDAEAILKDAGYDQLHVNRLLTIWVNLRAARELSDEQKAQRDLTKADVISAYKEHALARDKAGEYLAHLGYDAGEVSVILANADAQLARTNKHDAIEVIHLQYANLQVTRADAVKALDAIGTTTKERDALLVRWDNEVARAKAKLTFQQIGDIYDRGLFTAREVYAELLALNYTQSHALALAHLLTDTYNEATKTWVSQLEGIR